MRKEELEAYDAMIADRDRWRHKAEKLQESALRALIYLEDVRTDDLAELGLPSVARAISSARVALRIPKALPEREPKSVAGDRAKAPIPKP